MRLSRFYWATTNCAFYEYKEGELGFTLTYIGRRSEGKFRKVVGSSFKYKDWSELKKLIRPCTEQEALEIMLTLY